LSRFAVLFAVALGLALVSTAFAGAQLFSPQSPNVQNALSTTSGAPVASNSSAEFSDQASLSSLGNGVTYSTLGGHPRSILGAVLQYFGEGSLALAPGSWVFVGGLWIWRGRMKSRWEALGFDSEVFELFVRMRGGKTRVKLLNSLLIPKDRFQLAQELGLDWKAVDRHVVMLNKYGFVHEQTAYGRVRIYELTAVGKLLLQLLQNLDHEESGEAMSSMAEIPQTEV
jgi:hypothetical protein